MAAADSTCSEAIALAPEHAGAALGAGRDDAQVLRGQRQGPAVDHLADAGEQVLPGLGHDAADDDDRRVQHAHARGEDLADVPAGGRDLAAGVEVPGPHERHDVGAGRGVRPGRSAMAGPLATASRQPVLPQRHGRSSPPGTAMWPRSPAAPWAPRRIWPSEMIPAPMPVATFTNSRWSTSGHCDVCSPRAMTLTSLSTSTGTRSLRGQEPGHVGVVPARHDRRVDRPPGRVLDGAGQAHPDADQVAERASGGAEQLEAELDDAVQHGAGALRDRDRARGARPGPCPPGP